MPGVAGTVTPLADGEGFDHTAISQGKQGYTPEGEAKAEAFLQKLPPDLAALIVAWDKLPDAVKAGIMAIVRAIRDPLRPRD